MLPLNSAVVNPTLAFKKYVSVLLNILYFKSISEADLF
jgi:hypothetical protein